MQVLKEKKNKKNKKKKKEGGNPTKVTLESEIEEKVNEQSRQVHGNEINFFIAPRTTHGKGSYYETTIGQKQANKGDTVKFIGDFNSSDSIWIVPKKK